MKNSFPATLTICCLFLYYPQSLLWNSLSIKPSKTKKNVFRALFCHLAGRIIVEQWVTHSGLTVSLWHFMFCLALSNQIRIYKKVISIQNCREINNNINPYENDWDPFIPLWSSKSSAFLLMKKLEKMFSILALANTYCSWLQNVKLR